MNNNYNESFNKTGSTIEVDPEFQSLITPLKSDERRFLEADLIEHGCLDPILVWQEKNILLDGHNRYSICTKHNIQYEIKYLSFCDREDAKIWMIRHQLGRRNLTNQALSYYRGVLYNSQKKQGKRTDLTLAQNEPKLNTAEKLAAEYAVGTATIKRDGEYAEAIDILSSTVETPELKPKLLTKKIRLTKDATKKLARTANEDPVIVKDAYKKAKNGQDWFNKVKQNLEKKANEPFPYQVGEVVLVQAKDDEYLRSYTGYWAIVTKIHKFSCNLDVYDTQLEFVKADQLMQLNCLPEQTEQAIALMNRLQKLAKIEIINPMINDIRRGIGLRRNFTLNEIEDEILGLIESRFGVKHK